MVAELSVIPYGLSFMDLTNLTRLWWVLPGFCGEIKLMDIIKMGRLLNREVLVRSSPVLKGDLVGLITL